MMPPSPCTPASLLLLLLRNGNLVLFSDVLQLTGAVVLFIVAVLSTCTLVYMKVDFCLSAINR